jgi:hypothetical protein
MRPCSDISAPFSSRCPSVVTLWLSVAVDPATTNDNPCHSLSSDCKRRRPACAWPTPHTHTRTRTHTVPPYSAVRMDTVCVRTPTDSLDCALTRPHSPLLVSNSCALVVLLDSVTSSTRVMVHGSIGSRLRSRCLTVWAPDVVHMVQFSRNLAQWSGRCGVLRLPAERHTSNSIDFV